MVYNITKSDSSPLVSIPDSTQDTTSTSLILPGRNSVNFGLSIDQNFVKLLQHFANTTSPPNPLQGQVWFDSINNNLKVYDGSKWVEISTGFDGSSGITTTPVGPNNTNITIVVSQYQIIVAVSADSIARSDCPDNIIYNDTSYAFATRFPNGISPGVNVSSDPSGLINYQFNGTSTAANILSQSRTIFINGSVYGHYKFDGSSDVNVTITDSNVYVTNAAGFTSNITVAGTWTKVLVSNGGRILAGNNISQSDIVAALGYTPYDGANINVNAISNTVVARDQNANFGANIVVCNNLATNAVLGNLIGTASNALVLTNPRTIYIDGDVYGNVRFDGSSNVVIESNLVTSGVTAGVYNLVNVDEKGRVTNGGYYDQSPFNAIVMFPSAGFIPNGWAPCNGNTVVDTTTGTVTITPNLIAASSNLSMVAGVPLKYYIKYISAAVKSDEIPLTTGTLGTGPAVILGLQSTPITPSVTTVATPALMGGPLPKSLAGGFKNITTNNSTSLNTSAVTPFVNTTFTDNTFFDAVALIMGLGDTNGIMFSTYDVWNNLSSLAVQDMIDNLHKRAEQNLPAAAGKYMITISLLRQQVKSLNIPNNIAFSPLLQDQLMSSIINNFAHQLLIAGIPAVDNNLFGCYYFGSAAAWIAIAKSNPTDIVSTTLHNAGFFTTSTSDLGSYTRDQLFSLFANVMQVAKQEIQYRIENDIDIISSGQPISTGNTNVIVTTASINGYKIGDSNFTDLQGGYFPEYDVLTIPGLGSNIAVVGSSTTHGSIGTVSMSLADAGACALVGVLTSDNTYDQAGIAQVIVNRTGASASQLVDFSGKNGFDCATAQNSFDYMDAAIYGPNANSDASQKYGNLYVNTAYLKSALDIEDHTEFKISIGSLFQGTLSNIQLDRLDTLRSQVYNDGSEMVQAQATIGSTVEIVSNTTVASSVVSKPFGENETGYLFISPLAGFFVPNTCDTTASAPFPSPSSILDRLNINLVSGQPSSTYTAGITFNNNQSGIPDSNITASGSTYVENNQNSVSNQPLQPQGNNYSTTSNSSN